MQKAERRRLGTLWKLVEGIEIAMMTTVDQDGMLHSRPMATQAVEADEYLLFFAAKDSGKVKAIRSNHHVALVYADPRSGRYVSAAGRARVSENREEARKLWSSAAQSWFPDGPVDEGLVLIEVDVDDAQWWDGARSEQIALR
jgi:general stress protein 26